MAGEWSRVLETCPKHHKSKDHNFLHRKYTQLFFQFQKNIFFEKNEKSFFQKSKFWRKNQKSREKNDFSKNQNFRKIKIFDFSTFFSDFEKFSKKYF